MLASKETLPLGHLEIRFLTVDIIGYDIYRDRSLFGPSGAMRHFVDNGTETTRTLAMLTPGLIGPAYFREIAALLSAGGPPDPAKVVEVMAKHGLVVVVSPTQLRPLDELREVPTA